MNERLKFIVPLILFAITIGFAFENDLDSAGGFLFLMVGYIIFFVVFKRAHLSDDDSSNNDAPISQRTNLSKTPYQTYYGDELNFSEEELTTILTKRFPYFNCLSATQKDRFLERLKHFIFQKTFKIHDNKCFKEMPVLISAAAIQLTFGLQKYLLPNFEFIHVYPKEFIRIQDTICYLEGNVSGHAINLSWKHFLDGYANSNDGQNVGLHELAHALYYQNFVAEENIDGNFKDTFDHFNTYGNKVFKQELQPGNDLYSDYALKNFQEFWAESAEIFFENPAAMKAAYPQLYDAVKSLLNQDPYNKIALAIT